MSDESDDDLVPNVHIFPRKNTMRTQLSNVTNTNLTSMDLHNMMHSNIPNQYMGFDQRSLYSRRETSPMSLKSFPDLSRQYLHAHSQSGRSSQRSIYNGRCRSPMSVRSIGSNASVSAVDIAFALKTAQFNKHDLRLIREAFNKYSGYCIRRRIAKRRNVKSFIRQCRRKSGGESGVEGSDSSKSSDDCRSTRSALYKENISRIRPRDIRPDLNKFNRQVGHTEVFKNYTESYKQDSLRELLTVQSRSGNINSLPHNIQQNEMCNNRYAEEPENFTGCNNASVASLNRRFASDASFALPYQRFNKCNASPTKYGDITYNEKIKNNKKKSTGSKRQQTDNEGSEIFSQTRNLQQSNPFKRVLESTDISYPESKKNKLTVSPMKQTEGAYSRNITLINNNNDFNFKKPQLPKRKSGTINRGVNTSEILISKSSQPLVRNVESIFNQFQDAPTTVLDLGEKEKTYSKKQTEQLSQNLTDEVDNNTPAETTHNSTEVSMKPSFIKRKLFTQKLDVFENKNLSSDNLGINSPQTNKLKINGGKNKVRKLTSQSCLNRDDIEDNNYLDLIHRIVPPEQMNITSVGNKKDTNKSECNQEKDDKWDVTSVISLCKDNEHSDTYTDEEIFIAPQGVKKMDNRVNKDPYKGPDPTLTNHNTQIKHGAIATHCKVLVEKLSDTSQLLHNKNGLIKNKPTNQKTAKDCVRLFWDTDFESDMENEIVLNPKMTCEEVQNERDFSKNDVNICSKNVPRGAVLSVRSLRSTGLNNNTRADVTQTQKDRTLGNRNENKEVNNDNLNKRTRSQSKCKKTDTLPLPDPDSSESSYNLNDVKKNKQRNPKRKCNSTKVKETLNTSRQSLRLKQKKEAKLNLNNTTSTNATDTSQISSNDREASRESIRLKNKRAKKLMAKK